jgi:hypothetical protein
MRDRVWELRKEVKILQAEEYGRLNKSAVLFSMELQLENVQAELEVFEQLGSVGKHDPTDIPIRPKDDTASSDESDTASDGGVALPANPSTIDRFQYFVTQFEHWDNPSVDPSSLRCVKITLRKTSRFVNGNLFRDPTHGLSRLEYHVRNLTLQRQTCEDQNDMVGCG